MALDGTVKVPGIGPVSKKGAVYGTAAIVVIGGIYLWRKRSAASAAATASTGTAAGTGAVTDPAGNTCSAVNPATGFCPGTAEDLAAQQGVAYNTGQLGTGLAGYYYGSGGGAPQTAPGPGNFADNAEWSQYVINYMTQNLNANAGAVGDALGKYLEGQVVTQHERTLIEEAIAVGGQPPQAGPGGYPPRIRLEAAHKPPPKKKTGKVKVPDVTNKTLPYAKKLLTARDLKARQLGVGQAVASTAPPAGTDVDRGSTVTLYMGGFHLQPGK